MTVPPPIDATVLAAALAEGTYRGTDWTSSDRQVRAAELETLLEIAHALEETSAGIAPSAEFRTCTRTRLLAAIAAEQPLGRPLPRRVALERPRPTSSHVDSLRLWFARVVATAGALSLVGIATAHAATDALPGDPLYSVKELTEQVALQLADGESARAELLLHQADTRLDETTRLLQSGRVDEAAGAAARFEQTVQRAKSLLHIAPNIAPPGDGTNSTSTVDEALLEDAETRAMDLRDNAPAPVRAELDSLPDEPTPTVSSMSAVPTVAPATTPVAGPPAPAQLPTRVPPMPVRAMPPESASVQASIDASTSAATSLPARPTEPTPSPSTAATRPPAAVVSAPPAKAEEPRPTVKPAVPNPPASTTAPVHADPTAARTTPPGPATQATMSPAGGQATQPSTPAARVPDAKPTSPAKPRTPEPAAPAKPTAPEPVAPAKPTALEPFAPAKPQAGRP